MSSSVFYRSPWLYEALMRALYGRGYKDRSEALAALIPQEASVVDVCCGPATLYFEHLRDKRVSYTGLDINRGFIERLVSRGVAGMVWDVAANRALPPADYVIMQASLYHFLPDPYPVVERMLGAARKNVVLTEPVQNLTDSKNPVLAWLSRKLTNPGTGDQPRRFNERLLEEFTDHYRASGRLVVTYPIASGRERLCILRPGRRAA